MDSKFIYSQSTGLLKDNDKSLGYGYSGRGEGLNNPAYEKVASVGPIPKGIWNITYWWKKRTGYGPVVARLEPTDQDVFGRSGFLIHGDNTLMNNTASYGCIILSRYLREAIRDSGATEIAIIQ